MFNHSKHFEKFNLWLLLSVAIILNFDRLLMGEFGLLRQLDVSNMYINKIMFLSNYWTNPVEYGWNSSILRGWPAEISSILPNYFGVLIAIILPIEYVFPILHIILDFLVLSGAFLLIKSFLGFTRETAILGSFIFLSINYWYNENPIATAAPLLPLIVAVTTIGKEPINWGVRLVSMLLITSLSFPPLVLPMMPMVHILLLLVFFERSKFKQNLVYGLIFWAGFSVFHSVSLWGFLQNWGLSNRSLWAENGQSSLFINTFLSYFNQTTLFPALVVFSLLTRKTLKLAIYAAGIILLIIGITALNNLIVYKDIVENYPILEIFYFFFLRIQRQIHNFVGLTIFLIGVILIEKFVLGETKKRESLAIGFCLQTIILVIIYILDGAKIAITHFVCSSVIMGMLYFYKKKYLQKAILTFIILFIGLAPFRIAYSLKREQLYQGNLFLDPFSYDTEMKAFRVATIMDEHWDHEFFQAQASIKGLETFGGMSVFYSANDALLWQEYVADGASSLLEKFGYSFKTWNVRIDLVKADFDKNTDRIISLMKLNNVVFVRSRQPIKHDEFELVEEKRVEHRTKKTILLGRGPNYYQYYLYKIKSPISRIFTYDYAKHVLDQSKINSKNNKEYLNLDYVEKLDLDEYYPGLMKFKSKINSGKKLFISTNYSKDWNLLINGKEANERLNVGLLNMISIDPIYGENDYKLFYENSPYKYILSIVISLLFYILITRFFYKEDLKK